MPLSLSLSLSSFVLLFLFPSFLLSAYLNLLFSFALLSLLFTFPSFYIHLSLSLSFFSFLLSPSLSLPFCFFLFFLIPSLYRSISFFHISLSLSLSLSLSTIKTHYSIFPPHKILFAIYGLALIAANTTHVPRDSTYTLTDPSIVDQWSLLQQTGSQSE